MIKKLLLCAAILLTSYDTLCAQRAISATQTSATAGTQTWPSTVLRYPSGFQLSWNAGDLTLTHSADVLTLSGGSFLMEGGATINTVLAFDSGHIMTWNAGDVTLTHSANTLTLNGGALVVPTAAYNATTWNGSLNVPTQDAVRDQMELKANIASPTFTGTVTIPTGGLFTAPQITTGITTDSTTFALVNTTATTVNAFGAATTVNTGAAATQIWNFGGSTTASEFRYLEPSGSGTNYTSLKGQAQGSNITYIWPASIGTTGQVLSVTVSGATGTLSWVDQGAGSGSVATDAIFDAPGDIVQGTGANTAARLAIGTAGQLLQVNAGATALEYTSAVTVTTATAGTLEFEGATADASETTVTVVDPTADRTVTLPNADTFVPVIPQIITVTGPTAARTWTVPDAAFTVARADAAQTLVGTQTLSSTTSLLLGTAGSAVGNIGFRNATSGTATLAPPTGALGTYTVTLPNAASTLPIFGQQITFAGPTAARTITLPDAAFTVARTDAANTFTGVQTMTAPVFVTKAQLPTAAGSSALTTGGDAAYNTTNKVLGIYNGTKEVGVSTIYRQQWSFDPKAVCDGTTDRLFLMSTDISEPFGIHIVKWKLSFDADPTTEFGANHVMLKRADAFIGVANAANMDALDTTAGASSEATSSNINSDAVVATSKVIYLQFDTAYTEAGHQCIFEMWYEVEED